MLLFQVSLLALVFHQVDEDLTTNIEVREGASSLYDLICPPRAVECNYHPPGKPTEVCRGTRRYQMKVKVLPEFFILRILDDRRFEKRMEVVMVL